MHGIKAVVRVKMYYAKIIHEVAQHECSLDVNESFSGEQITLDTPIALTKRL